MTPTPIDPPMQLPEPGAAITARLAELAALTDVPGEITRLYLSPSHGRASFWAPIIRQTFLAALFWRRCASVWFNPFWHANTFGSFAPSFMSAWMCARVLYRSSSCDEK